jgi:uncharacterized phage-associated protein
MDSYSPKAVANAFLALAKKEGEGITPMKMQKLIYLAHGWGLGILGEPLINEPVQAWKYGPVIESIYHEFKHHGNRPILTPASNLELNKKTLQIDEEFPEIPESDSDAHGLITHVWNAYKKYTGGQLSTITHEPGTPWTQTYQTGVNGLPIPNALIQQHYQNLVQKPQPAAAS